MSYRPVRHDRSAHGGRILPRVDLMNSVQAANVSFKGKKARPTAVRKDAIDRLYRLTVAKGEAYRPGVRARANWRAGYGARAANAGQ